MSTSNCDNSYLSNIVSDITGMCKTTKHVAKRDEIINCKQENIVYFSTTENILNSAQFVYNGIHKTISDYRAMLSSFRVKVSTITETTDTIEIIKKQYDELITELYNTLVHYYTMESVTSGVAKKAIFPIVDGVTTRDVGLSYITCNGVVTNNTLAILDNITIETSELSIMIQIGTTVYIFYKSAGIDDFSINKMLSNIDQYESDVIVVQQEINKNIKIIYQAFNILNVLKKINC